MIASEHISLSPTPIEKLENTKFQQNKLWVYIIFLLCTMETIQDISLWPSNWDPFQILVDILIFLLILRFCKKDVKLKVVIKPVLYGLIFRITVYFIHQIDLHRQFVNDLDAKGQPINKNWEFSGFVFYNILMYLIELYFLNLIFDLEN